MDKDLEGTNNPAERALCPAVVMRKIIGGSRSRAGAQAWAKLASLLRTVDQRKLGVFQATKKLVMDGVGKGCLLKFPLAGIPESVVIPLLVP